jgi:hypothetical protein
VTVLNVAPTVDAGSDLAAFEGDAVLVTATFTDPGVLDFHIAQINWGDGAITAGVVDALTKTVSGMHVFADNGPYLVELTVTDDDGDSGSDSLSVSVANVAPVVLTGEPLTVEEGIAFDLPPTFFTDAGSADTHTATVDFGDGTIVPGTIDVATGRISASHTYGDNGEFTITVAVTDDDGDTGTGTWLVTVNNAAPPVSDFDGDGRSDILWRNAVSGENYLFPMDGTAIGAGEGYLRPVTDLNWDIAGVGDFDGDARSDILWRNAATGENYVYLMSGTAIAGEGYIRTVADLDWRVAGVGDFDGNGRSDILWRHGVTGENYLYLMDGLAIAGEGYTRSVSLDWRVAGVGDFDGDGNDDILWRNGSSGENYLYPMDGTAIGAGEGYLRTVADLNWDIAGVGDFDGDARSDILWRNAATGENYVYLMSGTAIAGEGFIRTVADLDWSVAALGDYDGDGMVDVLWRHGVTGENYLYLMDGLTIKASEGYVRAIPDQDWHVVYGSPWPAQVGFMLAGVESFRLASGDEASTLAAYTGGALALTAGADAAGEVDVVPAPERRAVESWAGIVELPANLRQHEVGELFGDLGVRAFSLFGHTGAQPALFSTEGVELDAYGRSKAESTLFAKVAHRLDGWIRQGDENDRDARRDKSKGGRVEWGASLRSLGAALFSGKSGARDVSHANFAEFDKPKDKSGR